MRRAWPLVSILVAIAGALPGTARADEKQACSLAYDGTQALRKSGKLSAARQKAALCVRDVCAEFIRADCARWLGEIESSQPTVVFDVRDASGKATTEVRVDLDGQPWLEALDGKSRAIDPGPHTLRYVLGSGGSIEDTVQILEGEKNRKLSASFQKAAPPPAPPPPAEHAAPPSRSPAPWILGGVGLAGLAVGGVLAGVVAHDKSVTETAACNQTSLKCNAAGLSAANQVRALGPASTVGFVAGGAFLAAGGVWLIVRERAGSPAPAVGMGPVVTVSGAGWWWQGTW